MGFYISLTECYCQSCDNGRLRRNIADRVDASGGGPDTAATLAAQVTGHLARPAARPRWVKTRGSIIGWRRRRSQQAKPTRIAAPVARPASVRGQPPLGRGLDDRVHQCDQAEDGQDGPADVQPRSRRVG